MANKFFRKFDSCVKFHNKMFVELLTVGKIFQHLNFILINIFQFTGVRLPLGNLILPILLPCQKLPIFWELIVKWPFFSLIYMLVLIIWKECLKIKKETRRNWKKWLLETIRGHFFISRKLPWSKLKLNLFLRPW